MTVNILGTDYNIVEDNDIKKMGYDGYCDLYKPVIKIRPTECFLDENADENDRELHRMSVIRHEIAHAYFKESGMTRWCDDEDLVEWISNMLPRMIETLLELDAI